MGKTLCAAPDCEGTLAADRPNRALSGAKICAVCRDKLSKDLVGLAKLYDDCEDALTFEKRGITERVGGWRPRGISLNETAVQVRADIIDIISSWAKMIVDEHETERPDLTGVWHLTTFLVIHFEWLLNHPAAVDFAEEISDLTKAAHQVIEPDTNVELDIGPCAHPGCGHTVCATIQSGREFSPRQVSCEAGHVVRPDQWLLHHRRLQHAKRSLAGDTPGRTA